MKTRTVQSMCAERRIKGTIEFGRAWMISAGSDKPIDNRIITEKYKDWRRCQSDNEE